MTLKELDKVIALCRKRGVSEITIEGVTVKLGDAPMKNTPGKTPNLGSFEAAITHDIETNSLSEEEMLFWSSQPHAGDTQ